MRRTWPHRIGAIVAWLAIWELAALAIGNDLLFCGPIDVVRTLALDVDRPAFWVSIGWSFARIAMGFATALACGLALGALAARMRALEAFLSPAVHVIKSAPVVCIIAILLVLFGSRATTSIVVAMVVFPPVYLAMIEAAGARRPKLDEMARVFGMGAYARMAWIELPQYRPFLRAALKTSVGMSWKAGVAAELIGLPGASIGEAVYLAKLSIDVPELIAWTAVVILLGWLCERVTLAAFDALRMVPVRVLDARVRRAASANGARRADCEVLRAEDAQESQNCADGRSELAELRAWQSEPTELRVDGNGARACMDTGCMIELAGIGIAFGEHVVLEDFELVVGAGERVCLMAPSGSGKTTVLRLLMGLQPADAGCMHVDGDIAAVFQDATLVEERTAAENLAMTAHGTCELAEGLALLARLLDENAGWEDKPVRELSGGMRRRVELARALAHPSCAVLLDEPFSGLDDATRQMTAGIVADALAGRTLVVATHDERDAQLLDARVVHMGA